MFYCLTNIFVDNLLISVSLMMNLAGLKLLQNSDKVKSLLSKANRVTQKNL